MRLPLLALPLLVLGSPVLAEPTCKTSDASLPMWQVAKSFEDGGGSITNMKLTNGCYEIYGREGGHKVELFYDPRSGTRIGAE